MDIPPFQILNPRNSLLGICDHLRKEISEAGAAELSCSCAVEVTVVDGFTIGGDAKTSDGGGAGSGLRIWDWEC